MSTKAGKVCLAGSSWGRIPLSSTVFLSRRLSPSPSTSRAAPSCQVRHLPPAFCPSLSAVHEGRAGWHATRRREERRFECPAACLPQNAQTGGGEKFWGMCARVEGVAVCKAEMQRKAKQRHRDREEEGRRKSLFHKKAGLKSAMSSHLKRGPCNPVKHTMLAHRQAQLSQPCPWQNWRNGRGVTETGRRVECGKEG